MEPFFKLRKSANPKADGNTLLVLQLEYSHKGNPVRFPILKLRSIEWTGKQVNGKVAERNLNVEQLNSIVRIAKAKIDNIVLSYRLKFSYDPESSYVKEKYYEEEVKNTVSANVITALEEWRINKANYVREVKTFKVIQNDLERMYPNKKLFFKDIDENFKEKYLKYLLEKPLQNSSIRNRFKKLKLFLSTCKLNEFAMYKDWKIELKLPKQHQIVILTNAEFNNLCSIELKKAYHDFVRDLYIVSCCTGLRFTDCKNIQPMNIITENNSKYVQIGVSKAEYSSIKIPLVELAVKTLAKYEYNFLNRRMSNQKANKYLEEIFKDELKLNDLFPVVNYSGSKFTIEYKAKYELCGFHSSRKFFVSRLVNSKKMSLTNIMKLSGHSTREIERYMSAINEENEMRQAFENLV